MDKKGACKSCKQDTTIVKNKTYRNDSGNDVTENVYVCRKCKKAWLLITEYIDKITKTGLGCRIEENLIRIKDKKVIKKLLLLEKNVMTGKISVKFKNNKVVAVEVE